MFGLHTNILTYCKIKEKEDDKKDKILERLLKLENENMQLMQKVHILETGKSKNPIHIGTINGPVNNGTINNNITIMAYGKEDYNKIDRVDLLRGLRTGFNSTFNLIDTVHFNPKYPEFHNVYISSMKNKYAMMYDGSDWTLVMKDDLIDKLYDDKRNYIEENLEDFLESLTKSQVDALHRWMEADESHPYIQKIKNDIKLLLYNKRKLITDPTSIDMRDTVAPVRVIKQPKGNIIDAPFRSIRKSVSKHTVGVQKRAAPRNGSKRKVVRIMKR